jgi:hypothetical protein
MRKAPGQALARRPRPSWDGPTRELAIYDRGQAAIPVQPALVAHVRPVLAKARPRGWRPDLWPPSIWVPLLLSTPVLGLGVVLATVHALSN